jgi:hypothetical protein
VEILNISATVGLLGQRFALREGGRTVGAGFVSIVIVEIKHILMPPFQEGIQRYISCVRTYGI